MSRARAHAGLLSAIWPADMPEYPVSRLVTYSSLVDLSFPRLVTDQLTYTLFTVQ